MAESGFDQCSHGNTSIRKRTAKNGVIHYCTQCLLCGDRVASVGKLSALLKAGNKPIEEFDDDLRKKCWENRAAIRQEEMNRLRREESELWWKKYNDYLNSRKWTLKRDAVLKRDEWICQACHSRRACQVHHLTYSHVFDEPLFDLVSVCKECHDKITELDRKKAR